jgi:opacity protein-like surface antigen
MKRTFALLGLAFLAAMPASAAERGFYWGLDLGQYSYGLDQNDIDGQLVGALDAFGLSIIDGASETSEDGFSYGITFGYQILRFLAVEAAYLELGDAEYKANLDVTDGTAVAPLNATLSADSSGPALSVLGILPISSSGWEVYGRAGMYFSNGDGTVRLSSDGVSDSVSDSANSESFLWGVGAGYSSGPWTLRLEYQQYMDVGDEDTTGEVDIDRITIGAVYHF